MKQFLKCLTIVALVATLASIAVPRSPQAATHQPALAVPKIAPATPAVVQSPKPAEPAPTPVTVEPTPPPVPAPAPVVYPAGCANYLSLVEQYDWPVSTAMAVMQAENHSCNPAIDNAGLNSNGSVDYGLFQVNSIHADMVSYNLEKLRIPSVNVAVAYKIWSGHHSFSPWSTFKSGAYLRYLQ